MKQRHALVAGLSVLAIVTIGATGTAGAADPTVPTGAPAPTPSRQYPATLGTGYRIGNGPSSGAVVSNSGRWVAFASTATNLTTSPDVTAGPDVYLRDRWTDLTVEIRRGPVDDLTISSDGNLVMGVGPAVPGDAVDRDGAGDVLFVYRHSTGRTVAIRLDGTDATFTDLHINNDGYINATVTLPGAANGTNVVARATDAGFTGRTDEPTLPQHARPMSASLRYRSNGPTFDGNTVTLERYDVLTRVSVGNSLNFGSFAFGDPTSMSANGRWVATAATSGDDLDVAVIDMQTTQRYEFTGLGLAAPVRWLAVGNAGDTVVQAGSHLYQVHPDAAAPATNRVMDIGTGFDGRPITSFDAQRRVRQYAADIDRVLVCTAQALTPVDSNGASDCYLAPVTTGPT